MHNLERLCDLFGYEPCKIIIAKGNWMRHFMLEKFEIIGVA